MEIVKERIHIFLIPLVSLVSCFLLSSSYVWGGFGNRSSHTHTRMSEGGAGLRRNQSCPNLRGKSNEVQSRSSLLGRSRSMMNFNLPGESGLSCLGKHKFQNVNRYYGALLNENNNHSATCFKSVRTFKQKVPLITDVQLDPEVALAEEFIAYKYGKWKQGKNRNRNVRRLEVYQFVHPSDLPLISRYGVMSAHSIATAHRDLGGFAGLGGSIAEKRWEIEVELLRGLPLNAQVDLPFHLKMLPKYAALNYSGGSKRLQRQFDMNQLIQRYGEIVLVLSPERIKRRATTSVQDSFKVDPKTDVFPWSYTEHLEKFQEEGRFHSLADPDFSQYHEVQIYGPVGVQDIQAVLIPENSRLNSEERRTVEVFASENHVPVFRAIQDESLNKLMPYRLEPEMISPPREVTEFLQNKIDKRECRMISCLLLEKGIKRGLLSERQWAESELRSRRRFYLDVIFSKDLPARLRAYAFISLFYEVKDLSWLSSEEEWMIKDFLSSIDWGTKNIIKGYVKNYDIKFGYP